MPDYYKALCEIAKRQDKALETARTSIRVLRGKTVWNAFGWKAPEIKLIDAARKEWEKFNATGN